MKVLLLSRMEIEGLTSMREVIGVVETAFKAKAEGRVQSPPKLYVLLSRYDGDFRTMPAYLEDIDAAGAKIVNVHPRNPKEHNLPSIMATILLLDPRTGAPLAVMDGTRITEIRTGAAGAIAAKYLARKDSRVVAIIGGGVQARTQLIALNEIMKIREARVYDKSIEAAEKYAREMNARLGLKVAAEKTMKETVAGADIVVTVTPVREPIVKDEWIGAGMHINAIGADAAGKEELDPKILKRAKIVVDDLEQAIHAGEVNVPFSKGIIKREDIYAELGEIVTGRKPGRTSRDEITIFDSTGLAIQDIATAWMVYKKAREAGKGLEMELL